MPVMRVCWKSKIPIELKNQPSAHYSKNRQKHKLHHRNTDSAYFDWRRDGIRVCGIRS
jgi:hypothetical protein